MVERSSRGWGDGRLGRSGVVRSGRRWVVGGCWRGSFEDDPQVDKTIVNSLIPNEMMIDNDRTGALGWWMLVPKLDR